MSSTHVRIPTEEGEDLLANIHGLKITDIPLDSSFYSPSLSQASREDARHQMQQPNYGFQPFIPYNGNPYHHPSYNPYPYLNQPYSPHVNAYSGPQPERISPPFHHQHSNASVPQAPSQWSSPPLSPSASYGRQLHHGPPGPADYTQQHRYYGYHSNQTTPSTAPSAWMTTPPVPQQWETPPHNPQYSGSNRGRASVSGPPRNYQNQATRMSWSGPSGPSRPEAEVDNQKAQERKPYHPQPPAKRSDWVMWVGNVPPNTSHEELWGYFNSTIPQLPSETETEPWLGPSSIFLISRSSCAFVNLSSQADLDRAVKFFNGKQLRPWDSRCPRMLCRVRKKDDDLKSGVGAQRGTGMHINWIKAQKQSRPDLERQPSEPLSPTVNEVPPDEEFARRRESIVDANAAKAREKEEAKAAEENADEEARRHKSTASYASTNSSFLARNFPQRIFILKSNTITELEESKRSGTWRTQKHNEPILDQAFRTSQEVFLIFGANKSGQFFGYAKMVEPIDKEKAARQQATSHSSKSSIAGFTNSSGSNNISGSSNRHPDQILEEEEKVDRSRGGSDPVRPSYFLLPTNSHHAATSPGELSASPGEDGPTPSGVRSNTDPTHHKPKPAWSTRLQAHHTIPGSEAKSHSMEPKQVQVNTHPATSINASIPSSAAEKQQALGGSHKAQHMSTDGVLRKDTILTPAEKQERSLSHFPPKPAQDGPSDQATSDAQRGEGPSPGQEEESIGRPFKIQWIKIGTLPFNQTGHLRNPWNSNREVKVSRDGTEVEPGIAHQLMSEWDKVPDVQSIPEVLTYAAV